MLNRIGDEVARATSIVRYAPHSHFSPHTHGGGAPDVPGVEFSVLYESTWELVLLERWAPAATLTVSIPDGIELLVLDGSFIEGGEEFTRLSWLRLPAGAMLQAIAGPGGCKV